MAKFFFPVVYTVLAPKLIESHHDYEAEDA